MARISQMALVACLALTSFYADAFIVSHHHAPKASSTNPVSNSNSNIPPCRSNPALVSDRRTNPLLFLSSTAESSSSSLKRLPESAVELTLRIPPAATAAAYDKTLSEVTKAVSIPGFRKGARIPPQVVENAWSTNGGKKALKTKAINDLCGELIGPALKDEHGLEPIGQPSLVTAADELAAAFAPGEELEVTVRCDVWPDIQWKGGDGEKPYLGLRGKYKRKPFNQERFDAALNDLTERYARLEPIEDAGHSLAMGDACKVNMAGYMADGAGVKGAPLPDAASGDDVEVILGSGRYMEGLVEGLVGGKVGETKTVSVRFPDALKNKDIAGKDAIFDVTILSASRRILPEITDEFAAQVRPELTADSLREELRKAVDSQDAQEYMGARNEALARALAEIMDVDVPDTLVTNQAREKYAMMMTDMRSSGMADDEIKKLISPENFVKYKDIEKPDIVRDFKVSMAVDEIARLEGIKVPAYQVEEQMQSLKDQAAKAGESAEDTDEEQTRRKVESTLERRMVYDFLADAAELEVEYVDDDGEFDEALMEKLATESLAREEAAKVEEGEGEKPSVVTEAVPPAAEDTQEVEPSTEVSSKEADLELTTQAIMSHINSQAAGDGIVDDDDDDED